MKLKFTLLLVVSLLLGAGGNDDAAKKEVAKLAGTWKITSLHYNGDDVSKDEKLQLKFTFKGNDVIIEGSDEVQKEYGRFKFKLDTSVKPKIIDMTITLGIQKDAVIEGIYELKDDELKICAKVLGNERPMQFESKDGSSVVLLVLKRMK